MMENGDVVLMAGFIAQGHNCSASFKAPKGRYAVFLLLGDADKKDPESFDCDAAMRAMGWVREDEVKP